MHTCLYRSLVIAFMVFTFSASLSQAEIYNSKECADEVNFVNKDLPKIVGNGTRLINTSCKVFGKNAEFTYTYNIESEKLSLKSLPPAFAPKTITSFCSGSETRDFLDSLTKVTMEYFDTKTGKFFGRIQFSNKDC